MDREEFVQWMLSERMNEILKAGNNNDPAEKERRRRVFDQWESTLKQQDSMVQEIYEVFSKEMAKWDSEEQEKMYISGFQDAVLLLKRIGIF